MLILKNRQTGFTLIELMIAVAIVGILAAIAYPSYSAHTQKTRRSDCQIGLSAAGQQLERCMTLYGDYTSANCPALPATSDEGHYNIAVARTATTFTLTCTPAAGSPQGNDNTCQVMTLANTGAVGAQDGGGNDSVVDCW